MQQTNPDDHEVMQEKTNPPHLLFSEHLFWDVERESLDYEKDKSYIIKQVLEYGLLNDWRVLLKQYGLAVIAGAAKNFRELDAKTASFVSALTGIPKEDFRCYKNQQSKPPYWHF